MVYSRPELTISFSLAPAIRALKAGVVVMGIDPARPPENLASRLRWTLSVVCVCVCVCVCFLRGYTKGMLGDVGFSSAILPYTQHGTRDAQLNLHKWNPISVVVLL